MSDTPSFQSFDLTELMHAGVLAEVNRRFFWPLGLALTWTYDKDIDYTHHLHVREWVYPDGHHEAIEEPPDDPVMLERHAAFERWLAERLASMPVDEAAKAAEAFA